MNRVLKRAHLTALARTPTNTGQVAVRCPFCSATTQWDVYIDPDRPRGLECPSCGYGCVYGSSEVTAKDGKTWAITVPICPSCSYTAVPDSDDDPTPETCVNCGEIHEWNDPDLKPAAELRG